MKTTAIFHLIAMPEDIDRNDVRTPFQGFSSELAFHHSGVFHFLPLFPNDIGEIFCDQSEYLISKMCGTSTVSNFLRTDLIDFNDIDLFDGLCVIWSNKKTAAAIVDVINKCQRTPLHISEGDADDGSLKVHMLNKERIEQEIFNWCVRNDVISQGSATERFENARKKEIASIFSVRGHNAFSASLTVLHQYGYNIDYQGGFLGRKVDDYIEEIKKITVEVDKIRATANVPELAIKNDAIIYGSAIYTYLYNWNGKFWNGIRRDLSKNERLYLKVGIVKNKGYSNFEVHGDGAEELINNGPYKGNVGKFFSTRSIESKLFTQIISTLAVSEFCPAIRLPNEVMHFHSKLKEIIRTVDSAKKNRRETLSTQVKDYSDSIKSVLKNGLDDLCFTNRKKIIAVCDFPLEWFSINRVPIMFTHHISRVSPTPGDLFLQSSLELPQVMIPANAFKTILVIRSFVETDQVSKAFIETFSIYKRDKIIDAEVNIVDVTSTQQVVDALNNFAGAIVIFDCHGGHDGELGNGWLQIGHKKLDTWDLANCCRIPPIVILSACSTHAPDGSHASVANGFFRCGAFSVIGTFAPIHAGHAAIFICRLLHRVSAYIPVETQFRSITWREIVSDFFKMSYATDILYDLHQRLKLISDEELQDKHLRANEIINSRNPEWVNEFFLEFENKTAIKREQLQGLLVKYYQFVDTMLYTHLGRPDNILIINPDMLDDNENPDKIADSI